MSSLSRNLQKNEEMVLDAKMHWITLCIHPIRYLTTELSLSTKRVVGKFGFVNSKQIDSPLNKINSVSVSSGLFGKIFGYATVTINTASTIYLFKGIVHADMFRQSVMDEMDRYEERRIKEQAEAMAKATQKN